MTLSGSVDLTVSTSAGVSTVTGRDAILLTGTSAPVLGYVFDGTSGTGGDQRIATLVSLINSATSSVLVVSNDLSSGSVGTALAMAASSGKSVTVVENLANRSGTAPQVAAQIKSAGGTVYSGPVPNTAVNNFVLTDGVNSASGNFVASQTAVQTGKYLASQKDVGVGAGMTAQGKALINTAAIWAPP